MKLQIICVAYERVIPLRILIDCLLVQSSPNWELHLIYDGPVPKEVKEVVDDRPDPRIHFENTPTRTGDWGHHNRAMMLQKIECEPTDFVLLTNDDNMYVPMFVELFLNKCDEKAGLVFCNTIHSYINYGILHTQVRENFIDMGSFAVRADVAKKIGFNRRHLSADGHYAEECANYCRENKLLLRYVPQYVFVHN